MKTLRFWKITALFAAIALVVACGSSKGLGRKAESVQVQAQDEARAKLATVPDTLEKEAFLQKVADNAHN